MAELTLAFRENTTAEWVKAQLSQLEVQAVKYNLTITEVSGESTSPAASQHRPARDPLSPASGSLLAFLELVGGESPTLGDRFDHCFFFQCVTPCLLPLPSLGLGCPLGASPCWCWSVFWWRWPSSISLPW